MILQYDTYRISSQSYNFSIIYLLLSIKTLNSKIWISILIELFKLAHLKNNNNNVETKHTIIGS